MASLQILTEYERKRLENIKRNDEMMASLKLHSKVQDLSSAAKRSRIETKGYKPTPTKKPKSESPIVIRRSLRTRGLSPDSVSARGLEDDLVSSPVATKITPPRKKMVPFHMREVLEGSSEGKSDRELVDTIVDISENTPLVSPNIKGGWRSTAEKRQNGVSFNLEDFKLDPENIARVVPTRILNVRFLPCNERRIIVAGDKSGYVGFWDVDYSQCEGDGVYVYSPHSDPVSGITVQPFSISKIFTSSYDGFIRLMDIEAEKIKMIHYSDDAIFCLSQQPHDMMSLYFGEGSQGELKVCDQRMGKISSSYILHSQRINSIDFNPENTNLMATSSTDGTACIWDLRRTRVSQPKSLKTVTHQRAVHSAFFSPSGNCLATTSYDNYVGLLSGVDFQEKVMFSHYNQTNRWISSFRAIWGWDDSKLFLGNVKRAVDIISTVGKTTTSLYSPHMTAIPCRFSAHPFRAGTLAGATGGGQVYMWTTSSSSRGNESGMLF